MAILNTVILVAAIAWSMGELMATHRKLRSGQFRQTAEVCCDTGLRPVYHHHLGYRGLGISPAMAVSIERCHRSDTAVFLRRPATGHGLSGPVGWT